jgi:hypothetical protein
LEEMTGMRMRCQEHCIRHLSFFYVALP